MQEKLLLIKRKLHIVLYILLHTAYRRVKQKIIKLQKKNANLKKKESKTKEEEAEDRKKQLYIVFTLLLFVHFFFKCCKMFICFLFMSRRLKIQVFFVLYISSTISQIIDLTRSRTTLCYFIKSFKYLLVTI